ncbi:hypothetical protein ACRAQ6_03950 [Erythrobacter sp. HA6-11]
MKTVYTDKLGLFAPAMLFVAAIWFWRSYESYLESETIASVLFVAGGSVFLFLAMRRVYQVRRAKEEGGDPSLLSVKNHD